VNDTTLYRLGGAAFLSFTLLAAISNVLYLMAGEAPLSVAQVWMLLIGQVFWLLGLFALFARQAERGGWLGLAGFVLLVLDTVYATAGLTLALLEAEGVAGSAQFQQAPSVALAGQIFPWAFYVGAVLFGIALYRGGGMPKYAGVLLALLGAHAFAGGVLGISLPSVIFVIVSFVAWGWLGLSLWLGASAPQAQPAAQPA
jgi:hypothetical protein